jgi:hypothetical protein
LWLIVFYPVVRVAVVVGLDCVAFRKFYKKRLWAMEFFQEWSSVRKVGTSVEKASAAGIFQKFWKNAIFGKNVPSSDRPDQIWSHTGVVQVETSTAQFLPPE